MKKINIYPGVILLVTFLFVFSSCSNEENVYKINPEQRTVVKVNKDINIVFPRGCVREEATIKIDSVKNIKWVDHDDFKAIGMPYKFDFSGGLLKNPAKIFIKPIRFYSSDEVAMGRFDGKRWHYLPIDEENGRWCTLTKRFSTYAPMVKPQAVSPIIETIDTNIIEFAKGLITGNYNSQWDRVKYLKIIGKYKIAGGITMNGGSFLVMATPSIIKNSITDGVYGVGKEITKDLILQGAKLAIQSPDIVSKGIAKNTIKIALREYNTSYSIARKCISTNSINSEDAYKFIQNYFGYYKLDVARRLYVRSDFNNISDKASDNVMFSVLKEFERTINSSVNNVELFEISNEIYDIMKLHKIGLAGFDPYIEFNEEMESIAEGENYLKEKFDRTYKQDNKNVCNTINFIGKILMYSPGGSGDSPMFILQLNNKSEVNIISGVTYEGEFSKNDTLLYDDVLNNYLFDPNDSFKDVIWEAECNSIAHEFGGVKYYDLISLKRYDSNNKGRNESINTSEYNDISDRQIKELISANYNIKTSFISFKKKKDDFLPGVGKEYLVLFYNNSMELRNLEKKCIIVASINNEWVISNEIELPAGFESGEISKVIDIDNDGVKEFMIFNANGYQGSSWEERVMFKYFKGNFKTIYHVKDESTDAQYEGINVEKRELKFTDYNKDGIIDIIETIYKGKVDENYEQNYKVDKKQLLIFNGKKYQYKKTLSGNINSVKYIVNEDFNNNSLDQTVTIEKKGGYNSPPGVKYRSEFQGNCFGFGKSTCPASCFDNNRTKLVINLPANSYVHNISFAYMELDGDWGSGGYVKIDGQKIDGGGFGSIPSNDYKPDKTIKYVDLNINRRISKIEIIVTDITEESEIFIDNLIIK